MCSDGPVLAESREAGSDLPGAWQGPVWTEGTAVCTSTSHFCSPGHVCADRKAGRAPGLRPAGAARPAAVSRAGLARLPQKPSTNGRRAAGRLSSRLTVPGGQACLLVHCLPSTHSGHGLARGALAEALPVLGTCPTWCAATDAQGCSGGKEGVPVLHIGKAKVIQGGQGFGTTVPRAGGVEWRVSHLGQPPGSPGHTWRL